MVNHQGSKVNYCEHQDQSVSLNSAKKLLKQVESMIKASLIIRKYVIEKNFYQIYYPKDVNFVSLIKSYENTAKGLDCQNEYEELLKKYDYKFDIYEKT